MERRCAQARRRTFADKTRKLQLREGCRLGEQPSDRRSSDTALVACTDGAVDEDRELPAEKGFYPASDMDCRRSPTDLTVRPCSPCWPCQPATRSLACRSSSSWCFRLWSASGSAASSSDEVGEDGEVRLGGTEDVDAACLAGRRCRVNLVRCRCATRSSRHDCLVRGPSCLSAMVGHRPRLIQFRNLFGNRKC